MPKSKKKKSRKNKKNDETQQQTATNPINTNENIAVQAVANDEDDKTNKEATINNGVNEVPNVAVENTTPSLNVTTTEEESNAAEVTLDTTATDSVSLDESINTFPDSNTPTPVSQEKVKKKRFSFLRRKKRASSLLHVNTVGDPEMDSTQSGNKVQRASSMSHFGREAPKSKIPLHKFRSSGGKKKNNLSASCSNVESTSLVLNPGMDDWRMTGLLDTVDKSNSIHSLNTSTTSTEKVDPPAVALVPSFNENKGTHEEKDGKVKEEIELVTKKNESPTITIQKPDPVEHTTTTTKTDDKKRESPPTKDKESDEKKRASTTTSEGATEDFVETNIDFEYSAEIHQPPASEELERPNTPIVEIAMEGGDSQPASAPLLSDGLNSPTLKDATTDAELYELENDERVVTIRKLEDIVRENKLIMPAEVISNDWLVLNLSSREIPSF